MGLNLLIILCGKTNSSPSMGTKRIEFDEREENKLRLLVLEAESSTVTLT